MAIQNTVTLSHILDRSSQFMGTHRKFTVRWVATEIRVKRPVSGRNTQQATCKHCKVQFRFNVLSVQTARRNLWLNLMGAGAGIVVFALTTMTALGPDAPLEMVIPLGAISLTAAVWLGYAAWLETGVKKLRLVTPGQVPKHTLRDSRHFMTIGPGRGAGK